MRGSSPRSTASSKACRGGERSSPMFSRRCRNRASVPSGPTAHARLDVMLGQAAELAGTRPHHRRARGRRPPAGAGPLGDGRAGAQASARRRPGARGATRRRPRRGRSWRARGRPLAVRRPQDRDSRRAPRDPACPAPPSRPGRALLDDVEAHKLAPGDIDAGVRNLLFNSGRPELRERARMLKTSLPDDRRQVLDRYKDAALSEGDAGRGRLVFQKNCATCHNVAGIGVRVGPDIADTRVKTREQLLSDILNPNGAIDGNYLNYVVEHQERPGPGRPDRRRVGIEPDPETRRGPDRRHSPPGHRRDPLHRSLADARGAGEEYPVEEMSDLITFLKNWHYDEGDHRRRRGEPRIQTPTDKTD